MPIIGGEQGGPKKVNHPVAGVTPKTLPQARKTNVGYGTGPVSVYVRPDMEPTVVKHAIKLWNSQIGFQLFRLVDSFDAADIVIGTSHMPPTAGGWTVPGGWTRSGKGQIRMDEGSYSSAEAIAKSYPDLRIAAEKVQHELGHAVGLDHPGPKNNPYMFTPQGAGASYSGIEGSAWSAYDIQKGPGGEVWGPVKGEATQSELDRIQQLRDAAAQAAKAELDRVQTQEGRKTQ